MNVDNDQTQEQYNTLEEFAWDSIAWTRTLFDTMPLGKRIEFILDPDKEGNSLKLEFASSSPEQVNTLTYKLSYKDKQLEIVDAGLNFTPTFSGSLADFDLPELSTYKLPPDTKPEEKDEKVKQILFYGSVIDLILENLHGQEEK